MSNEAFIIAIQSGVPPFAVGEPGTSKTRTTEAFAKSRGLQYECIIGSQHDPVDIGGIPKTTVHSDGRESFRYVQPEWWYQLEHSQNGGLLHLDELVDCPPAVQAAFLQILGDGIPRTWICATGNPLDQSTNGYALGPAVINRLCLLDWETPIDSWKHGFLHGWNECNKNFPVLVADWQVCIPDARITVKSFLDRKPDLIQKVPQDFQSNPSPFPTLRSWTNAATLLAAAKSIGSSTQIEDILIAGCVGLPASIAFREYRTRLNLPDPEELLANPGLYNPKDLRGDQQLQVLSAVITAVLRKNTETRWLAAWDVIDRQCDVAADIAAVVASPLSQKPPPPAGLLLGGKQVAVQQAGVAPTNVQIPASVYAKLYSVLKS